MSLSATDFEYVRNLVKERSAIILEPSKTYLVDSRLTPIVRKQNLGSLGDLVARLRNERFGELHRSVIEAMTTNETSFFRDVHPFEVFKKKILPDLIAKRSGERALTVWCGACSSGQEPYSIAMLMRESFPELAAWRTQIIATDLSTEILDRAKRGTFSQLEVNRGLPAPMLVRYFTRNGPEWQVCDQVRKMITFRELNLIDAWPSMPRADVVFLRNVLIYFDIPTKKSILAKVRQVMRPEGYLFLGGAETTMNLDDAFERMQFDKTGCYRIRDAAERRPGHATA
ncbi:MAG: protein-glutamate O-methyltransferase CheR [Deltaproteobacteria bacterium]|nr:protein-glutamate O-methyltransferase CheR [Deltaproteobacteria bacterium]